MVLPEKERAFLGVWIPAEILEKGFPIITEWVLKAYGINLLAKNPMQEDKKQ